MTTERNKIEIPEELIDQLLATVKDPSDLTGAGGLMRELMGRLVEKSLNAELGEHLGCTCTARGGLVRTRATARRRRRC